MAAGTEAILEDAQKRLGVLVGWVTLAKILRKLNKAQVRDAVEELRQLADKLERELL